MSLDFSNLMGAAGGTTLGSQATSSAMGIDGIFPSLTLKQRIIGFASCFTIGMLLSFMSTLSILDPVRFSIMYTLGNVIALFSTAFLFGPCRQLKNMFARTRIIATFIYLAALVGTLVVAIKVRHPTAPPSRASPHSTTSLRLPASQTESVIGVLCMIAVQFLALVWYTISYIPYARDLVWRMLGNCCKGG